MFGTNNLFYIHTLSAPSKPSTQEEYNTPNNKKDISVVLATTTEAPAPTKPSQVPAKYPHMSLEDKASTIPKPWSGGQLFPPEDEEVVELVEAMKGFITMDKARSVLQQFETVDNAFLWLRAKFCGVIDDLDVVASDDDVSLSSESSESYADEGTCHTSK